MSRRLRYQVAASLDGFIAGPRGDYDWIVMDPAIDFGALFAEFDTAVMGRKTYEVQSAQGNHGAMPGMDAIVFSKTLPPATYPGVRITNDDPATVVKALKAKSGRDIWLYGGGEMFRTLLDAGLVDTVEIAVIPVLLGAGVPLLPPGARWTLVLSDTKTLPASGIMVLAYAVTGSTAPAPRIAFIKADTAAPVGRVVASTKARAKSAARKASSPVKAGKTAPPKTIDAYLKGLRPDQKAAVQRLRQIIHAAAPRAEECISYQIPAFRLDGKGLIWFGAGANHSAIYSVTESYKGEFKGYDTSGKGTLRFPLDKPVPVALVRKLVKRRMQKIAAKPKR